TDVLYFILLLHDFTLIITLSITEALPISFPGDSVSAEISQIITADLQRSGLFAPIDPRAFTQDAASLQSGVRFADWKVLAAQARSEEHTSELQLPYDLVCRLLLGKKNDNM